MIKNKIRHFIVDKWAISFILLLFFILPLVGHTKALVYLCVFSIFILLGTVIDTTRFRLLKYIFLLLLISSATLFAGFRDFGVGTDTNVYIMRYFREAASISSFGDLYRLNFHGDKAFLGLACISNFFSHDPQLFLVCIAFVIYSLTFLSLIYLNKENKEASWSTFLFLWIFSFYNMSFNAMRQYCAMSFLLLAFVLLLKEKWLKSLSLVVPAYFFHSSSLIFLPVFAFYRISKMKNRNHKVVVMAVFIFVSLICVISIFKLLPTLGDSGLIAEGYADVYGGNAYYNGANLFGPTFLASYVLILYIIWKSKQKNVISAQFATIAFGMHAFYFILRLTAFYVIFLARLSEYYYYCDILIISILISKGEFSKKMRAFYYACVIFTWVKGYIFVSGGETYPYISTILGITG